MSNDMDFRFFMAHDAATDYFSHNVAGCWDGENTPCFFYSEEN